MDSGSTRTTMAWFSLAAATIAAAAQTLQLAGIPGPWTPLTLLVLLLAAGCLFANTRAQARLQAQATALRAQRDAARADRERLQLAHQRHAELEQQLLRAKQEAEQATLAKGEFLATMSHEIRTPLNGIIPMLELIGRGQLGAEQRQMLQTAAESSQQLLRIVDDILDYSRLEAHGLELEITTFNLRELLENLRQLMQRAAEAKNLALDLELDPAVRLAVRGDPVRLRQVLGNLLVNAVKFTDQGRIEVAVRRLGETPAQHRVRFEIRDTGIGIDDAQQARLFHSFTQADASTTRLYGGTGLGLAICKRIVDLMHGQIGVDSVPGKGSTFWFEIPLLKVVGDLQPQQLPVRRALLVSPDQRLHQRLDLQFRGQDVALLCVENVQQALERLRSSTPVGGSCPFAMVIGDASRLELSAHALQRAMERTAGYRETTLVWLQDEGALEGVAPGNGNTRVLPRDTAAASLRQLIADPPSAPVSARPAPLLAQSRATTDAGGLPRLGLHVLLVEDNAVNLLVAEKLLEALGCRIDSAAHGEEALQRLQQDTFDVVLMDCQMPVLDGYAATGRWRVHEQQQQRPRLPIVAMTANAMAGDRERCLQAGMDDYLSKPVNHEDLLQKLQRWCPDGSRVDSLPAPTPRPQPSTANVTGKPQMPTLPAANATLPVLDVLILDELRDVVGEETARIIALFLEDTPRLVHQLQEAAASGAVQQLGDLAHTLKSSAANVGAMSLSATAGRIELAARGGLLDRPAVAVALVTAEFSRSKVALTGYLAGLRSLAL